MTGNEAVAALPDSVRIGPYDFAIEMMSPLESASRGDLWGECSTSLMKISMSQEFPSAAKAVDTFLHECLHALFWAAGIEDADKEERIVGHLGTALTGLHRDNPWLTQWLQDALG